MAKEKEKSNMKILRGYTDGKIWVRVIEVDSKRKFQYGKAAEGDIIQWSSITKDIYNSLVEDLMKGGALCQAF